MRQQGSRGCSPCPRRAHNPAKVIVGYNLCAEFTCWQRYKKSLYSNNKAFAELNKYYPNTFSKFDIGNYVELARKIKNYKEDYTEAIDKSLEKYNLENNIRLHMDIFEEALKK